MKVICNFSKSCKNAKCEHKEPHEPKFQTVRWNCDDKSKSLCTSRLIYVHCVEVKK
jgi:hypothetical protein